MKFIPFIFPAVPCAGIVHAKSDTDVTILEAKRIEIRDDHVIVVGRAITRSRVVDSEAPGDFLGRSSTWIEVLSANAIFVINKPRLNWNGPAGGEKARYERVIDES